MSNKTKVYMCKYDDAITLITRVKLVNQSISYLTTKSIKINLGIRRIPILVDYYIDKNMIKTNYVYIGEL